MFCPICNAEYRQGFLRCSDCGVELVETLRNDGRSRLAQNDRPDKAPQEYFLAWFLPMSVFVGLYVIVVGKPSTLQSPFVAIPLTILIIAHNFGAPWMMYQSIRYEQRVAKYFFLSFVPFMFVWYRLVRYPLRRELPRLS